LKVGDAQRLTSKANRKPVAADAITAEPVETSGGCMQGVNKLLFLAQLATPIRVSELAIF
jgi:hypothetical protein